jgi:hypothetical protein
MDLHVIWYWRSFQQRIQLFQFSFKLTAVMTTLCEDLPAFACMCLLCCCVRAHLYSCSIYCSSCFFIVAAVLQSVTSLMLDYSGVARAQGKSYVCGALYLHFLFLECK